MHIIKLLHAALIYNQWWKMKALHMKFNELNKCS